MTAPLLAASTERLVRELRRHIGAHADIVANDLIASGVVVPAAPLANMTGPLVVSSREALAAHFRARINGIWATEYEAQHRERGLDMMTCNDSICRRAVEDADALLASGLVWESA